MGAILTDGKQQLSVEKLTPETALDCASYGAANKGRSFSINLSDTKVAYAGQTSGFSISVFSPCGWVALQSSKEELKEIQYQPTDEDLSAGLFILATPNSPKTDWGRKLASPIGHILILSENKVVPLHPTSMRAIKPLSETELFAPSNYQKVLASFDSKEFRKIQQMHKKGEFHVVVIGQRNQKKEFKIKSKHFRDLISVKR